MGKFSELLEEYLTSRDRLHWARQKTPPSDREVWDIEAELENCGERLDKYFNKGSVENE